MTAPSVPSTLPVLSAASADQAAASRIDEKISSLADWRGSTLAYLRRLIHAAVPEVVEEWKWRDTPVFSLHGILCTGESYQSVVKLTFAKGAALPDPSGLFNSSLGGNVRRAIDLREGETVDEEAFRALFAAAAALNIEGKSQRDRKGAGEPQAKRSRLEASAPPEPGRQVPR